MTIDLLMLLLAVVPVIVLRALATIWMIRARRLKKKADHGYAAAKETRDRQNTRENLGGFLWWERHQPHIVHVVMGGIILVYFASYAFWLELCNSAFLVDYSAYAYVRRDQLDIHWGYYFGGYLFCLVTIVGSFIFANDFALSYEE